MRTLLFYIFTASLALSQPYQINPVNMTRSRTREAWITVNSNTTYFSANLGGGTAQTNISYTAVTNAPWQFGSANLTNWAALATSAKQDADSDLTTIAGLTATTDNFLVGASSAWASRTPTQAKTSLALVKADVGLSSVDNTSDAGKPVSTAQEARVVQATNGLATAFTSYSTIANAGASHGGGRGATNYWIGFGDQAGTNALGAAYPPALIPIVSADYPTINGVAPKLRMRIVLTVNNTAPSGNYTFGLYSVTKGSGGTGLSTYTMGTTAVSGSTVAIATPAGSTAYTTNTSDFALPSDGIYVFGFTNSATVALASQLHISAMLQRHNN
jgi:hypothetical protein